MCLYVVYVCGVWVCVCACVCAPVEADITVEHPPLLLSTVWVRPAQGHGLRMGTWSSEGTCFFPFVSTETSLSHVAHSVTFFETKSLTCLGLADS